MVVVSFRSGVFESHHNPVLNAVWLSIWSQNRLVELTTNEPTARPRDVEVLDVHEMNGIVVLPLRVLGPDDLVVVGVVEAVTSDQGKDYAVHLFEELLTLAEEHRRCWETTQERAQVGLEVKRHFY